MSSPGFSDAETFELFFRLVGFELEAFQREIVAEVFSPRRETLVLEPRGNGKTTLLAGLALFELLVDPYLMASPAQRLESEGIRMIEWRQDNSRMVPATQTLYEAVVHKRLRHGGHPVARSHALAAGVRETERGLRIKKTASRERIDCTVALAMAAEWASRQPEPRRSVYETRGLTVA